MSKNVEKYTVIGYDSTRQVRMREYVFSDPDSLVSAVRSALVEHGRKRGDETVMEVAADAPRADLQEETGVEILAVLKGHPDDVTANAGPAFG